MRILVADDEAGIRMTLEDDLRDAGFEVKTAADGKAAWGLLEKGGFDMLVSDIVMPGMDGLELLQRARAALPDLYTVLITGNSSDARNRRAVELGCNQYLHKPFNNEQIVLMAREAQSRIALRQAARAGTTWNGLTGQSRAMREVFDTIETIADSDFDVLITGQNGTGKEAVARRIHELSSRKGHPFVPVHCGMYAETLIEDELFGHEKGAYTGADSSREGRFERADKGTVFLDDIDDMPLPTQVKLLRVLQEREVERLGGSRPVKVDVRVIAATKLDLEAASRTGKFRNDLYYRLAVIPINLPRLAERHGDIPLLVDAFVERYGGGKTYTLDEDCLAALEAYEWPGNVRELENAVKRAMALSGRERVLRVAHFLRPVGPRSAEAPPLATPGDDLRELKVVLEAAEKAHIAGVLRHTAGARQQAAEILGISRKSLWEKCAKYGLDETADGNGR